MVSKLNGSEVRYFHLRSQEKEQQRNDLYSSAESVGAMRLAKAKSAPRHKIALKAFR